MAKKTKSTSKLGPVLVLAAVLGGGYYWLSTNTETNTNDKQSAKPNFTYVSDIPRDSDEEPEDDSWIQEEPEISDPTSNSLSTTSESSPSNNHASASHKEAGNKRTNAQHKTKNAYVDEYGNVIYTKPNGKDPIRYTTFKQGRWGYVVSYPTFLTNERHAQNSDGGTFEDGKGRKLITYASWNVFNETISELYHKDFPEAESITYKKLFRQQKYYVKSGFTKDNRIFYLKEAIYEKDDQEVIATLVFYYPKSYKNEADKVVKEVFSSFPKKLR